MKRCLQKKPCAGADKKKKCKTADQLAIELHAADKEKRACAETLIKWYEAQRVIRSGSKESTDNKATWP